MKKFIIAAALSLPMGGAGVALAQQSETTASGSATINMDTGKTTFSTGVTHTQTNGGGTTSVGIGTSGRNIVVQGSTTQSSGARGSTR